jgi:SAM-dependent methyltransferase
MIGRPVDASRTLVFLPKYEGEVAVVENDWWRSFFTGVTVDFWLSATTPEQTRSEADFLERMLRLAPGARVLDVPCGGGRHAVELAARGFEATGVDLSSEFLAAAQTLAPAHAAAVTWEQREMRDLPWPGRFDGAYCFGNSFSYLDDPGNADFLLAVARALKPGGRFALETGIVAESFLLHYQERRWYEIGNLFFLIQNRYDHVRGGFETEYIFVRDGKVERKHGWQRVYTYSELRRLFETAGFSAVEGYGSLTAEPYRLGSPSLYLTATRNG